MKLVRRFVAAGIAAGALAALAFAGPASAQAKFDYGCDGSAWSSIQNQHYDYVRGYAKACF